MLTHKHLIIRAEVTKPLTSIYHTCLFLEELIDRVNMKVLHGPVAEYCNTKGNRGITGFAIIETSHVVVHVWDENSPALVQLDVYSCAPFDPENLISFVLDKLDAVKINYKFLDRDSELTEIPVPTR
jgi:S-adenosylmethionine/arginine decarboxylase-like enzyme